MTKQKPQKMDGYIRVSARSGREGAGYISPDTQREAIQRWADYRGIKIDAWEVDEDESGGSQDRPGLRRIMDRIEAGQSDGIACWKLNRFARNVAGAVADVEAIQAAGGCLAFTEEEIDPSGPFGSFILTVLLAVATLELDNIRESWKVAKSRAMARGAKIGPTPFGYQRSKDLEHRGELELNPTEAVIVQEAYRLASRGIPATLDYLQCEAPDREWTTSSVRRLLGRRAYLGESIYGKQTVKDAHPALVDRLAWERAQHPQTKRRASENFPLSGIVSCGTCGKPMVGSRGGNSQRTYRCSASRTGYKGERCPAGVNTLADPLEAIVLSAVRVWVAGREGYKPANNPVEEDTGKLLATLEQTETNLNEWAANEVAQRIPTYFDELTKRDESYKAARLEFQAAAKEPGVPTIDEEEFLAMIEGPSGEDFARAACAAFESITVARGHSPIERRVRMMTRDGDLVTAAPAGAML